MAHVCCLCDSLPYVGLTFSPSIFCFRSYSPRAEKGSYRRSQSPPLPSRSRARSRSRSLSRSRSPSRFFLSPPMSLNVFYLFLFYSGRAEAENIGNTLYVTGLSTRVTERDLESHFSKEGKVSFFHRSSQDTGKQLTLIHFLSRWQSVF